MPSELTGAPRTDPLTIYRFRDGMFAADLLTAAIARLGFFSWLADGVDYAPTVADRGRMVARKSVGR